LELKTKKELGTHAHHLAGGFNLVRYRSTTYMPVDYETLDALQAPDPERTVWLPLTRESIRLLGASEFNILFQSDGELSSFDFMVAQNSEQSRDSVHSLLVRTPAGLRELKNDGQLHEPTGRFIPNTLAPMLNEDESDKKEVFNMLSEWVDSEEEAHSLLKHLATALAPGWSAVKYVLLLGEGRNGKGLLLKMIQAVFGRDNVSSVSRQHMAEQSPVVCELNGKLLNIVFDGMAEYVKDSGTEKTLVAGEPAAIRRLYESTPTVVQTNALFIEALNHEPKSKDKSLALQKRLMRFHFPNVYALDHKFERQALSEKSLGAFMSLLIDHYVLEDSVAKELAPTQRSMELQLEHMFVNSIGLQYLKHVEVMDPIGVDSLIGLTMTELTQGFQSWRLKENDLGNWPEPDVVALFQPIINTERKGIRVEGKPRKVRVVSSLKPESLAFIESLKGEAEDDIEALVAD
jgi:hypothetical protein